MKRIKQRKKKINVSRSNKYKVGRNDKNENPPPSWWKSLVDEVFSFIDLRLFEDRPLLSGQVNPKHVTALQILFNLLVTYGLGNREDTLPLRKCEELYEKVMKKSFPLLGPWEPPVGFPSLNKIYETDAIWFLKAFYEKQEPRLYTVAVKLGLFESLCWEARLLGLRIENDSKLEGFSQEIKDFAALIDCALYPIIKWRYLATENDEDAKMYLRIVGESLNPSIKKGRKPKRPLGESTEFPHLYNTMVCILYGAILMEFQKARKVHLALKSRLLEEGFTGLISSKEDWDFRVNPNEAAKKVLIKLFDWDEERTLNTVLGKRSSLLDKLKTIRESLRQELETIPF